MTERDYPFVNFLEVDEDSLEYSSIPNCFHFASSKIIVKSPKIPVIVEGIRVPMILDTGAEISALPLSFFDTLFPGQAPPESVIRAFGFGGSTVRMRGPVTLHVEVCAVNLLHSFYFYEDNPTFLMGYDLISTAALVIDPVNKCVLSRHPPIVVGQPDTPTEFTSSETRLKVVDSETIASCLPVEPVYAVPNKVRPYTDQSCSALCAGSSAEVTLPDSSAPDLCSVVPSEHGRESPFARIAL